MDEQEKTAIRQANKECFNTWLKSSLHRHRIWLSINTAGMTLAAAGLMSADPMNICFPGPLGGGLPDTLAVLLMVLILLGNTIALVIGLLDPHDNSASRRMTLFGLWLLTPFCWMLALKIAVLIANFPDCSQYQ